MDNLNFAGQAERDLSVALSHSAQASGADVLGLGNAVFGGCDRDLVNVGAPASVGLDVAVADLVAAHGAFTANTAYSGHSITSRRRKACLRF